MLRLSVVLEETGLEIGDRGIWHHITWVFKERMVV